MAIAWLVALVVTVRIGSNDGDDGEDNNCDLENDLLFYWFNNKINNLIRKNLVIASYYLHVES